MLGRRGALQMLAAALMTIWIPGAAKAGVARPVALRELVRGSRWVIVGTPLEAIGRWEEVGKSRRIVTYHRIRVDRALGGKAPLAVIDTELGARAVENVLGRIAFGGVS